MKCFFYALLACLFGLHSSAWAVATVTGDVTTYKTSEPTGANITNWPTGTTGWDYVGSINGGSAVYLKDGWVLSVGHLNIANSSKFTLSGVSYDIQLGSIVAISDATGTADLVLFKITTQPNLASLEIVNSTPQTNSRAVMIGYGDGSGHTIESWGTTTVLGTMTVGGVPLVNGEGTFTWGAYKTVDYVGSSTSSKLVSGDSGGADFFYDTSTHTWKLAGINELTATDGVNYYSYMVDLNNYADEIDTVIGTVAVPEPSTWALAGTGAALLFLARRRKSVLA